MEATDESEGGKESHKKLNTCIWNFLAKERHIEDREGHAAKLELDERLSFE